LQFQDIFKNIPSFDNLNAMPGESPAASPAAAPDGKLHMPRVASLDCIRAYFTSRQNNNAGNLPGDNSSDIKVVPGDGIQTKLVPPLGLGLAAAAAESAGVMGMAGVPTSGPNLPIASLADAGVHPVCIPSAMAEPGSQQALAAALAGASVVPGMLPYIAALNAAAAANGAAALVKLPSSVPTSATGAGSLDGDYSSGGGGGNYVRSRARNARCGSEHHSGDDGRGDKTRARRERRMLSNRESARRSRKRKQEHLAEVEEQLAEAVTKCQRLEEALRKKDEELASLRADGRLIISN